MRWSTITSWLAAGSSLVPGVAGIYIDIGDAKNVTSAAIVAAENMLTFYNGTKPGYAPGILTNPYYWWEAGAMFGVLIQFWHLTGDDSFNQLTMDGLIWQRGAGNDFEPVNQTKDLGNDDQSFWAYAALDAAEFAFPNPASQYPSWLSLAQAVFNRQIARWDPYTCGGGIRWQIYQFNPGYTYKNTAANGGLFHIAARLARFTGNATYAQNADKVWDWMVGVNFVIPTGNISYAVIDGAPTTTNCSGPETDGIQWTYNHGTVLMGAAYMYNYTNGSSLWRGRLQMLINGAAPFFVQQDNTPNTTPGLNGTIMSEVACEWRTPQTCKVDQPAFKAMLIRWLAVTTQLAPWSAKQIVPWLNGTASHAAGQCVGGAGSTDYQHPHPGGAIGTWCGRRMYCDVFDGYSGLGEQMSAMSAMQNVLIAGSAPPYTTVTGGNSTSDPNAGNTPTTPTITGYIYSKPLGPGDTAGAWILTVLGIIIIGGGTIWMVREEPSEAWGGAGDNAEWLTPASGNSGYYKKTYGYGAYRLAGLQAGGVYAGKNSSARLRFARPSAPTIGQGSGGWWFGTGQGIGEKWWDKKGEQHAEELAEKMPPDVSFTSLDQPRDSVNSYDSRRGLFARFKGAGGSSKKARSDLPGGKDEKAGEWKSIGRGVFVRQRDAEEGEAGNGAATAAAAAAAATMTKRPESAVRPAQSSRRQSQAASIRPSRRESRAASVRDSRPASVRESRIDSRRESRAASIRTSRRGSAAPSERHFDTSSRPDSSHGGCVLHWPAAAPEPQSDDEDDFREAREEI